MIPPEWLDYRFDPDPQITEGRCFTEAFHIAHLDDAMKIISDGRVKAGLVYDESRLRTARTAVSWVSPNDWALGSIYGSVRFRFPWKSLQRGRSLFWVEAITKYRPVACRFLLTETAPSATVPYDPQTAEGPLRLIDGQWYRNENITLELMLDGDLSLPLRIYRCGEPSPSTLQALRCLPGT